MAKGIWKRLFGSKEDRLIREREQKENNQRMYAQAKEARTTTEAKIISERVGVTSLSKVEGQLINVPDFKDVHEFETWTYRLKDADIQSWTTQDWLKMYEKLDKIPKPKTDFEKCALNDALIKLNRNYRMEEADYRKSVEIGRRIGHNLAQAEMTFDLASVNVDNNLLEGAREEFAQNADEVVWKETSYPNSATKLSDYDAVGSKISIVGKEEINGAIGVAKELTDYSSEIKISNSLERDVYGAVPVHESVHSMLQGLRNGQKEAIETLGLKPNEALSEDFYKLLDYNDKYYVSNLADNTLLSDLQIRLENSEITAAEFKKLRLREVSKGYISQPLEKQAQLMALAAEHSYRQETGQVSERTARAFVKLGGKPMLARYNDAGAIDLMYHAENKEAFEKNINAFMDDELRAKISLSYDEKSRIYKVTVPSDMKVKDRLDAKIAEQKVVKNVSQAEVKDVVTGTAERGAVRVATKTTMKTQAKTAVKTVGAGLATANRAYDTMFDRNMAKLMEMDAPQWMKSVDKAMGKVVDNKATRYTAEQLTKWANDFVKTPAGAQLQKQVEKSIVKIGGEAALKSAAKKVPLVCVGVACAMAKDRFENGEYIKGSLEVASGMAACVPVIGTAVSLGIDGAVLLSDLFSSNSAPAHVDPEFLEKKTFVAESTYVDQTARRIREMRLPVSKKPTVEQNKKDAKDFEKRLYPNGNPAVEFFNRNKSK